MALHILQQTGPTTGEKFGQSLATGLSALAEGKLQQVQQRNRSAGISSGLQALDENLTPEQIKHLVPLLSQNPQALQSFVEGKLKQPGEEAYAQAINQLISGGQAALPKGSRLNSKQATDLANLQFKKQEAEQKHQEKKQTAINATNKTYNEALDKAYNLNQKIADLGEELKSLAKTGKVASGLEGQLKPQWLLNDESRRFEAISNELATLIAAQSGIPTNFKIKLAQTSKPNLTQSTKTQLELADHLINQTKKVFERASLRDELISENNGEQPANLSSMIEKKYREMSKKNEGEIDSLDEVKNNLSKNNAPVGTQVEDEEGNVLYWNGTDLVEEL